MAALFQKRKKEPAEKAPVEAVQALQETIVCPACGREINKKEAEKNLYVCYECGSYFRVRTRNRIRMVADAGNVYPRGSRIWRRRIRWSSRDMRTK